MPTTQDPTQILKRRDTTARWAALNPVLGAGEPAVDMTDHTERTGDGTTPYLALPFFAPYDGTTNLPPAPIVAALDERYVARWTPEQFGAVGDGTTGDSAAIQAALTAITNAGGGVLEMRADHVYLMDATVIVGSNTIVEGNGATVKCLRGSSSTTFVNQSAPNALGYGAGGRSIHFRNLRWLGDYATVQGDIGTGWNHVENLSFTNCTFEQGMANGHYIDLGGCRNVRIIGCTFLGMNPLTNRNYIEAVQIDVNTMQGSSWKAEPASSFDGLPTRDVLIDGCFFGEVTVGSTTYPAPNPVGSHTVALETDAGYYENIRFVNNTVRGTYKPATQAVSGWCHFYGARGVDVSGNTFIWTGAAGASGNPQVVSFTPATSVIPASDVGLSTPGSVALSTTRQCRSATVARNRFIGFSAAPTQAGTGLVSFDTSTSVTVSGNTVDGSSSAFVRLNNARGIIAENEITATGSEPAISLVGSQNCHVRGNTIAAGSGAGIQLVNGSLNHVEGNTIGSGSTGIIVDGSSNSTVYENVVNAASVAGVSVGPTGSANSSQDVMVGLNRIGSSTSGFVCLLIGATAARTRRLGNFLRGPGTVTDGGSGTVVVLADQTT